ncbi:isopeptide-forming domain-containing fimbrial protein [Bifidobacterium tissieri]|uniref:Isopeptide-forming domain-containing fimbrial protein n=1 Tax=Bifidobacterium tissieri TaxID=1630162 RepID=A0A5M9ZK19_9BIFI|nr:isopeptide-forming domain-containing fimbrial protein [Bifidobacterium tissieri]KAA8827868.1 isopeptide-forming domain-containing fimbrial protein [Bifidobacterium tissieri]KAA8829990.1 isopeptide-forming domain-containing fimbrial protein [Bifidobacterium tissieri]
MKTVMNATDCAQAMTRVRLSNIIVRIVGIVAAMIMTIGLTIPGWGIPPAVAVPVSDATENHPVTGTSITITADTSAQIRGHTFAAYRLGTYTTLANSSSAGLDTITEPASAYRTIQNAMAQANPAYNPDVGGDPLAWAVQVEGRLDQVTTSPWTGLTRSFATALDPNELGTPTSVTANDDTIVATGEKVTVTIDGLQPGLYLVVDATVQHNADQSNANDSSDSGSSDDSESWTNSIRMVVGTRLEVWDAEADASTTLADGVINLKNQSVPIHKQIVDPDGRPQPEPDYGVGDTIYYEITSTVPIYTGYASAGRVYQIIDTMSHGLTYGNVVAVKVGETALTESTNGGTGDYTVSVRDTVYESRQGAGGQVPDAVIGKPATEIAIDLGNYVNQNEGTQPLREGANVIVTITATLNDNAVVSEPNRPQANPNKVDLTYSHNPEDLTDRITVPGGEVNVYTFRFRLRKVDLGTHRPLAGAKFIVKSAERGYLKEYGPAGAADGAGNGEQDGKEGETSSVGWRYTQNAADAKTFVSDDDGLIGGLTGLDAGTYTVTETQAPDGYQSAVLPEFGFTITADYRQDSSTRPDGTTAWGDHYLTAVTFSAPEGDSWKLVTQGTGGAGGDSTGENNTTDGVVDADSAPTFEYIVGNVRNVSALPKTGAAGVVMLAPVVALLVAGAVVLGLRIRALQRSDM